MLIPKLTALRKRGMLPKVKELEKVDDATEDHGFHDMDDVANG
jgi:hypothetical protein